MKALRLAIATGLCVIIFSAVTEADTVSRVILPGENVFCHELTIYSGDEAVLTTPCTDYDKARESAKQGVLAVIDELEMAGDYQDEQVWVEKVNALGTSLESELLGLEILFTKQYGEDLAPSRSKAFANERTNNNKAIYAYGELVRILVQAHNEWITVFDAHEELKLKLEPMKVLAGDVDITYSKLYQLFETQANPTRSIADKFVSETEVHVMYAKAVTIDTSMRIFEDEYGKILDRIDLDTFSESPAVEENLTYLATAHRGKDWEELFELSRPSRNLIGQNLKDKYEELEKLYTKVFQTGDTWGCFERGVFSEVVPLMAIESLYNRYRRL